nr:immunoglobulin heavy chain junction region [Mus musculus]
RDGLPSLWKPLPA